MFALLIWCFTAATMLWGICLVGYYIFNSPVFHVSHLLLYLLLKRLSCLEFLTNIWKQLLCCLLFVGFYLSSSLWIQRQWCRSVSFLLQLKHSGVEDHPRWYGYPDLFSLRATSCRFTFWFSRNIYQPVTITTFIWWQIVLKLIVRNNWIIMIFTLGNLRCWCATERLPFKINLSSSYSVIYSNIQYNTLAIYCKYYIT